MQAPFADPLLGLEQHRTSLPLVGRDTEMQIMRSLLDTVALNLPMGARALTISGEMGVGKTRLLAALCLEAREHGFLILEASAYEAGSIFPYFPFMEALRPLLRLSTLEQLRRYLGLVTPAAIDTDKQNTSVSDSQDTSETLSLTGMPLVATLTRLFPELPLRLQIEQAQVAPEEILLPDQEKFRLLDAIATLLEQVANERPILLCIDNLQWADSASLELTLYLTVRLRTSRVALVGVTRPPRMGRRQEDSADSVVTTVANNAATKALTDLMRQGMLLFLPLGPLKADEAAEHLQALLPGTLPQSVAQVLLTRAEGNPFFLEELVRALTLNQHLVLREGVWRMVKASNTKLPDSIVLAVGERLQGLSEQCHNLLQVAALFGRNFPIDALALVLEQSPEVAQQLIDEAVHTAIIAMVPTAAWGEDALEEEQAQGIPPRFYIFCQGIVQEALHAEVPAHRARSLHNAIGRALEETYAHEAREHAAELARHYAAGGEKEATLHWSLLAGEDAVRQQAQREAISHFRRVLKLLDANERGSISSQIQMPSIAELHITIGEQWSRLGELEQAVTSFQQALQILQYSQDMSPLLLARTNRLLADAYRIQARYDQALAHLQAANRDLHEEARSIAEIRRQQVAYVPWFPGRSFSVGTAAAQLEQVSASERILFLQSEATLDFLLNRPQEAETALWQSHQLATAIGDRSSQAFALHLAGWIHGWGERIHEAIRLLEQAHEHYIAIGDPFRAALGDQALGIIYQALGEMERARLYTLRGIKRARRYGVRRIFGLLYWNQGMMELLQGNWESSKSYLQQAMQEATTNDDIRLKPLVMQAQAELQFRRGNWSEAEQLFLDSIQAATATEWLPGTIALYGHFLAVTGRPAAAQVQLDRAAEHPEPPGFNGHYYIPFLAEGYLHLKEPERAATYIERIRYLKGLMYYGNSVDRILGIVATQVGDWETAERAFEEGLVLCQRAGNQPEEAAILYEQARAALMRGDAIQHVNAICTQARELFLQYGMQRAADMVETLQEGAEQLEIQRRAAASATARPQPQLAPSRPQGTPAGYTLDLHLTKRELEVLRLVAEGHTDREVADTLIISPRTVNRHLGNIFVKLDMPGRAAAVAYAIRQGLV
ncbi:MAG: AAA family ATPase [Chloroflexi bacterium]|nr:AAA family ATPase [Chloroflexota bacterium]